MHARLRAELCDLPPRAGVWFRVRAAYGPKGPPGTERGMRSSRSAIGLLVLSGVLAGCGGGDDDYANNPRPPVPINVAAAITDEGITVSPNEFGAGPVVFIIANQTDTAQKVTLETNELGGSQPGIKQTTSPINPDGTATLKVDMRQGDYAISVEQAGIDAAEVAVGAPRESAQNELLQP